MLPTPMNPSLTLSGLRSSISSPCNLFDCGSCEPEMVVPEVVNRECATTFDGHDNGECDSQKVIFEALAFLVAIPIHEQSVAAMHHQDRAEHCEGYAQSRDSAQQSN